MALIDRSLAICLLLFQLLLLSDEVDSKVPAIIVFGDSTVDAGNNNRIPTIVKSNFAPYGRDFDGGKPTGRFSNGRIATDFISEAFGIKQVVPAYLDPMYSIEDFATGVTFASAGTGLDNKTSDILGVIPLWKELEFFKDYKKKLAKLLGRTRATETIREAVYIISIGTNDFIENYFLLPGRSSQFTVEEYENFLSRIVESFIIQLYRLGARKISLGGLPPIGCLPLVRTLSAEHACLEEFNNLAINFDKKGKQLVGKLRHELHGIKLVFSNIYYAALDVIEKPYLYVKFSTIIVFGDSIVDAGNNNRIQTFMKCNFEPYGQDFEGDKPTGRFCNGRLFTDFISEALGMKPWIPAYLDPEFGIEDFTAGVSFASSGSGFDNFTSELSSVISLWEQLEYFKDYQKKLTSFQGMEKATEILHKALYIVTIGTNDFLTNYFLVPARSLQFSVNEYEAFLIGIAKKFVEELYRLGARKISVGGLPGIGCLPISRTSNVIFGRACREDFNKVARDFNVKLQNLVANLREELEGVRLVYSELYNIFLQVIQNPYLYGGGSEEARWRGWDQWDGSGGGSSRDVVTLVLVLLGFDSDTQLGETVAAIIGFDTSRFSGRGRERERDKEILRDGGAGVVVASEAVMVAGNGGNDGGWSQWQSSSLKTNLIGF
ncbi:Lipase [Macleaya cordata]|uniref:Lipase n=1 Tax=Macleaya cordata TaxID=56857 RepID=A0A200PS85_MACCD|nr:Lipase [Macleaya cordata]